MKENVSVYFSLYQTHGKVFIVAIDINRTTLSFDDGASSLLSEDMMRKNMEG
jgi:hypothetical protein